MLESLLLKTIFGSLACISVYLAFKFEIQQRNITIALLFGIIAMAAWISYHYAAQSGPLDITMSGVVLMAFALYVQHIFKGKTKSKRRSQRKV